MNRLDAIFGQRRPVLVCYLPIGDPSLPRGLPELYRDGGADVFEIGVPVRRPYLDGPTIAASMRRSAEAGLTAQAAAAAIAERRTRLPDQPMVWMTYPEATAADDLIGLVAASGVDGLVFPAPARRFAAFAAELERRDVHFIHFVRHELPPDDVLAARRARGYVMLQAAPGRTGARDELTDNGAAIQALRAAGVSAPIALGFGISTPEQARAAVAMGADGVVVGSATVEAALRGTDALSAFLRSLRSALDEG